MDLDKFFIKFKKRGGKIGKFLTKNNLNHAYICRIRSGAVLPTPRYGEMIEGVTNGRVTYENMVKFYYKKKKQEKAK